MLLNNHLNENTEESWARLCSIICIKGNKSHQFVVVEIENDAFCECVPETEKCDIELNIERKSRLYKHVECTTPEPVFSADPENEMHLSFERHVTFGKKWDTHWLFSNETDNMKKKYRLIIIDVTSKFDKQGTYYERFLVQKDTWLSLISEDDLLIVVSDEDIPEVHTLIDKTRSPRRPNKGYYAAQFVF
eukprot:UN28781